MKHFDDLVQGGYLGEFKVKGMSVQYSILKSAKKNSRSRRISQSGCASQLEESEESDETDESEDSDYVDKVMESPLKYSAPPSASAPLRARLTM